MFLQTLFAPVAPVTVRRMFGGYGIYKDGVMFALHADGLVFLKTHPDDHAAFSASGRSPFSFTRTVKGRTTTMVTSYWTLPSDAFEDPDLLRHCALRALAAADAGLKQPRRGKR